MASVFRHHPHSTSSLLPLPRPSRRCSSLPSKVARQAAITSDLGTSSCRSTACRRSLTDCSHKESSTCCFSPIRRTSQCGSPSIAQRTADLDGQVRPTLYQPSAASSEFVTAQLLNGNIADINVSAFAPGVADAVLKAISRLGGRKLHGVILDLRGNRGGLPTEVSALLGAFAHDKAYSYDCTVRGSCTANYVDNTTPLLQLPLVVLTDRNCVSACEAFSAAVKDLHLGTLVGTRTGGIVAGPATPYVLNDSSVLALPARHELAARPRTINGIGAAPDYYLPRTADDLSTGHDPDLAKALNLLTA